VKFRLQASYVNDSDRYMSLIMSSHSIRYSYKFLIDAF